MSEHLAVYLHDHHTGAGFAIELLETLSERHANHRTGILAASLLEQVREDRHTLEAIIERVGKTSIDLRDAGAWPGEKVSRLKLSHGDPTGVQTFEALETLALGIMGKLLLWRTLGVMQALDPRVAGFNYTTLGKRARAQFDAIEQYRLETVAEAFVGEAVKSR